MASKRQWEGRIFLGRDENGKQKFWWCGRWPTKRERDAAVAKARTERPWENTPTAELTCGEWVDRYLARYSRLVEKRERKASSLDTARLAVKRFRAEFADRPLASITPVEAEDWASTVPAATVPQVVALFGYAKRMQVVDRNPFEGLGKRGRGRADEHPPSIEEMGRLLDACVVLGDYGPQMRALLTFAAYTGMRPGELFALCWSDIDLTANRITVARRLYRGRTDTPKSGKPRRIALPPPARDAIMRQPTRTGDLVFVSKLGHQLTAPTISQYWAVVRAAAGLDASYDLYRCTRHFAVHNLYLMGLSSRAIAAQCGWSERSVEHMLKVYGHSDLVALTEVDRLYKRGKSDADVTQEAPDAP